MAHVIAINISDKKGVVKTPIEFGEFRMDHGLIGDAHSGDWHRQVSLLGKESMDKMENLHLHTNGYCTGKFAENLTTEGIVLYDLPIGSRVRIGETEHEVTQIGKQCHHGCEIKKIVGDCVMPKEGIFTKVIQGGIIKPGDEIVIL